MDEDINRTYLDEPNTEPYETPPSINMSRRRFLGLLGGVFVTGAAAGVAGNQAVQSLFPVTEQRAQTIGPVSDPTLVAPTPTAVPTISPNLTPTPPSIERLKYETAIPISFIGAYSQKVTKDTNQPLDTAEMISVADPANLITLTAINIGETSAIKLTINHTSFRKSLTDGQTRALELYLDVKGNNNTYYPLQLYLKEDDLYNGLYKVPCPNNPNSPSEEALDIIYVLNDSSITADSAMFKQLRELYPSSLIGNLHRTPGIAQLDEMETNQLELVSIGLLSAIRENPDHDIIGGVEYEVPHYGLNTKDINPTIPFGGKA
jgi:hypothetical protein